jgi:hypothetical protein
MTIRGDVLLESCVNQSLQQQQEVASAILKLVPQAMAMSAVQMSAYQALLSYQPSFGESRSYQMR